MSKKDEAIRAAVEALQWTIRKIDAETCAHEDTYRGGAIWTICRDCDRKWADDRGGFIPYTEPKELTSARSALSLLRSAMEEGEEPVAWYHQHVMKASNGIVESWLSFDQNDEPDLKTEPGTSFVVRTPLYASPIAADTKDKQ